FRVVSPDVGGVFRTRALGKRINAYLAIVYKRRERAGESEVMNIIGDVNGRKCLLVDDIVDSAGTLCNAAAALMDNGASSVSAYVTHGVLSGAATERVNNSVMEKLLITDSIQPSEDVINSDKFFVITIAPLIGEAMLRTTEERSVSSLFD
ncbi:MAG: ribose-phosphate diphosphokinase, partial [Pseudomonadota bacterium]|nr:ribose-phosphate diphosphokinase [Pseudomonadota bacterium]